MSLQNLIAAANQRLTPTDRRIAQVVLDDPTLLAFGTVSDLAARAKTSRPSIVRFASRLGFEGYSELQGWSRDQVTRQLSSPRERIRQRHTATTHARQAILSALETTFAALDADHLSTLAAPIAQGEHVWIVSGETSMAGAHALASGLSMIRPDVRLIEEHSTGRDLSAASSKDTAVVFDFARYRRHSVATARALASFGVTLVAITDGPFSPLASLTKTWCELKIPAVGPFDSAVPAVIAAELLVVETVRQLGDDARERIDQLETFWEKTDTFLHYQPRDERNR